MQHLILKIQPNDAYRICIYQTEHGYKVNSQVKKSKEWRRSDNDATFPDDYQGAINAIKTAGSMLVQYIDKKGKSYDSAV